MKRTTWILAALTLIAARSGAAFTPAWFDGYDVSQSGGTSAGFSSFNINEEIGSPRQGGPLVPTAYVTNTADPSNDFRHQLFPPSNGFQPLQLAGDAFLPGAAPVLASPNEDFSGALGAEVLGKRVTLGMDVASAILGPGTASNAFVQAGLTLGAPAPLVAADAVGTPHFGVLFIEDTIGGAGLGPFLQFYDETGLVQNQIPNPAGFGAFDALVDIDDPTDGDPWDGVGVTQFTVSINGAPVGMPHTIGGGGLTSNYLTLLGGRDFVANAAATHIFDNLAVYSAPIPEPASLATLAVGCVGAFSLRRKPSDR